MIERLWNQFRKSEGRQGPMPSVDCLERSGLTVSSPDPSSLTRAPLLTSAVLSSSHQDLLFGDLYRLSDPLQRTLVSPSYDHAVPLEDVITQVDVLVAQFRPSRDFIDNLPEEILIRIGLIVLERPDSASSVELASTQTDGLSKPPLTPMGKQRRRDDDRLSLSAVCRRWRAIFGLGEFWDEVNVTRDASLFVEPMSIELRMARGRKVQQKLATFLSRGGVKSIDLRGLYTDEELLPALDAMEGRSAAVRSWWVTLPKGVSFVRALDVWKAKNDCHLDDLWISTADLSLPSRSIDLSSLTTLRLSRAKVDLVSLLPRLPNLTALQLDHCSVDRANSSVDHPIVIRLANLSTLVSYGHPGVFYQAGSVLFETPNMSELRVQGDPDEVAAFLPLSPRPSLNHLKLLELPDIIQGDYGLVPILDRHPSIVELRLCPGGAISTAVDALGRGTCPSLRVLRILPTYTDNTLGPDLGQSVLAMVRAREAAADKGDSLTALWEFHLDNSGWIVDKLFSDEEKDWMWAHLRVFGGFGPRPK